MPSPYFMPAMSCCVSMYIFMCVHILMWYSSYISHALHSTYSLPILDIPRSHTHTHTDLTPSKNKKIDVPPKEFDFESNLDRFDKVDADANENEQDSNNNNTNNSNSNNDSSNISGSNVYSKDDFFDSISCDALDKAQGIDNRLRGAAERSLNLDTFGAVSLGHNRRGGRGGRGGGRGRGRGRGYGRGGRGRGSYNNNDGGGNRDGDYSGSRRGGTVGSGPAPKQNNRWKSSN